MRRHVVAVVSSTEVEKINEFLLRQGMGPNCIDIPITTSSGTRATRHAIEAVLDRAGYAAMKKALDRVPKTRKVVEVTKIERRKKPKPKLDSLLSRKHWKRKTPKELTDVIHRQRI